MPPCVQSAKPRAITQLPATVRLACRISALSQVSLSYYPEIPKFGQGLNGIRIQIEPHSTRSRYSDCAPVLLSKLLEASDGAPRSEERRVGKECRSRWS